MVTGYAISVPIQLICEVSAYNIENKLGNVI